MFYFIFFVSIFIYIHVIHFLIITLVLFLFFSAYLFLCSAIVNLVNKKQHAICCWKNSRFCPLSNLWRISLAYYHVFSLTAYSRGVWTNIVYFLFAWYFCVECQIIWDEVGESDSQRDATLLEIEQKCLDLYRNKVDEAKLYRAQIQQEITDYVGEIAGICAALGEQSLHVSIVGTLEFSVLDIFLATGRLYSWQALIGVSSVWSKVLWKLEESTWKGGFTTWGDAQAENRKEETVYRGLTSVEEYLYWASWLRGAWCIFRWEQLVFEKARGIAEAITWITKWKGCLFCWLIYSNFWYTEMHVVHDMFRNAATHIVSGWINLGEGLELSNLFLQSYHKKE